MRLPNSILVGGFAALCLTAAVQADEFHVGPAASAEQLADEQKNVIEGVLLRETETHYVVRIEGGEIQLPKSQVRKVVKTATTTAQIQERENEMRDRLAAANQRRRQQLAAYRAQRAEELEDYRSAQLEVEARAAAGSRGTPVEASLTRTVYDPVIGVTREVPISGAAVDQLVRNELGGLLRRKLQEDARRLRRELRR